MIKLVVLVLHFFLTGVFNIDKSHLQLTICPRHRKSFCITWRSNKRNCTALISVKGEWYHNLAVHSTGVLVPMALRKFIKLITENIK